MPETKTKPVPIRIDARTDERLRRAAKKMGSNRASVIRFAIINQLPDIEAGHITLRPDATPQE